MNNTGLQFIWTITHKYTKGNHIISQRVFNEKNRENAWLSKEIAYPTPVVTHLRLISSAESSSAMVGLSFSSPVKYGNVSTKICENKQLFCQGKHKLKVSCFIFIWIIIHPLQKCIICYLKDIWTVKQGIAQMHCLNGTFIRYVTLRLLEGVGCKLLLANPKRWKGKNMLFIKCGLCV